MVAWRICGGGMLEGPYYVLHEWSDSDGYAWVAVSRRQVGATCYVLPRHKLWFEREIGA